MSGEEMHNAAYEKLEEELGREPTLAEITREVEEMSGLEINDLMRSFEFREEVKS